MSAWFAHCGAGPRSPQGMNMALLCAYGMLEGMDFALLPASMRGMEMSLGFSLARLAALTAAQGMCMAVFGPMWAVLADNGYSKRRMLAGGAASWALLLTLLALASDFATMLLLRSLNGVVLAILIPVGHAMIAEMSAPEGRGSLFGILGFCQAALGMMPAAAVGTVLSTQTIFGIAGWRVTLLMTGLFGAILSPTVWLLLEESPQEWRPERICWASEFGKLSRYLSIPSFCVIMVQGMFSSVMLCSMQFLTLHFQYQGLPDGHAALVAAASMASVGLGYYFGGIIGDAWAKANPSRGRVWTAQLSTLLQLPMFYMLFGVIPSFGADGGDTFPLCVVFICCIWACSWTRSGCNRPILTELVPGNSIASITAWGNCAEYGAGMMLGPAIVGLMSERYFGFQSSPVPVSEMSLDVRAINANALASSLLFTAIVPQAIAFCVYIRLHYTYAEDVARKGSAHGGALSDAKIGEILPVVAKARDP